MVGHSQRGQHRLLAVLLDPLHVSLSEEQTIRSHTTSAQREVGGGNEDRQETDIFLQINANSRRRTTRRSSCVRVAALATSSVPWKQCSHAQK